jgi:Ca2+-binding RTX toxin-like protein
VGHPRWRFRAQPGTGDTVLQVLSRDSQYGMRVVAETAPQHVTDDGVVSLPAQVPVAGSFTVAARSVHAGTSSDLGAVAYAPGEDLYTQQPPAAGVGATFDVGTTYADRRLLVQADVEPDVDRDGKGDISQDSADLRVAGAAAGVHHTYTVLNAGPDAAQGVTLALHGGTIAAPSGVTCAADGTCRIGSLAAGASIVVSADFPAGVTAVSDARVSAFPTPDPDTTNNAASLTSTVPDLHSYVPTGTPQRFVVVACANVIKGTRDDDVLRGTVFGDRLVGGDGADLLKGDAGDDCLEGGSGADVLDGGNGNDRLAGDSGNDRLTGGNGNDRLTGGRGNDRLSGGNGNDIISPGAGKDTISGGPGDDTINSVDGVRETVDCGSGRDTVRADRRDHLIHCERITRKR